MKNFVLRTLFSAATLSSLVLTATTAIAGPVRLSSVKQIVNSNPSRPTGASAARLVVAHGDGQPSNGDNNGETPRVITEEESIIVEEEACACPDFGVGAFTAPAGGGFPWWTLGLGAVPLGFLAFTGDDDNNPNTTPTPFITPSVSPGVSPSPVNSPTPVATPTASPTATPVATPTTTPIATPTITPSTPTPNPEPVPEPATILLFGTGLTGLGVVARRFLKKREDEEDNEKES